MERIRSAVTALPSGAKRRHSKDPIQKWYPYYAGYSLEFAEAVLKAAQLPVGGQIFDPWNGSGTTTLAAARLGLNGRGFDLNPVAVLVARARLVNSDDAKGVRGFVREVSKERGKHGVPKQDELLRWLMLSNVEEFRHIQDRIVKSFASPEANVTLSVTDDHFPPLAAFLLLALIRAAKTLVSKKMTSNPTTFHRDPSCVQAKQRLPRLWSDAVVQMGDELPQTCITPTEPWVMVRDARIHSPGVETIDFGLTSPPYCTRLDYADATGFELAALGSMDEKNFQTLRRELMGAPLVRTPDRPDIPKAWPTEVQDILTKVRTHPSKASDSYYYKTYWQYFEDAFSSLKTLHSALKPGAATALVLQSSYYKDVRIDLPALYVELAESVGFEADIAHSLSVRTVISSIHPGTKQYRKCWDYQESVVLLLKEVADGTC